LQEEEMTVKDEKVMIVGGSSGIGLGVAEALLDQGALVTIVGRSEAKLRAARAALGGGDRVKTRAADVIDEEQVQRLFAETGTLDHLVVTRGALPLSAPIGSLDLDAARHFIDVMVVSALSLAKHATSRLRRGGSITFTSGISKDKPGPGGALVAAVAGSMGYVARALALELAPTRVNVVSPGWVETPMWDDIVGPAKSQMWAEMGARLPAGRVAKPADIAKAYTFLLGSELTTGIVLDINGGHALI
jgi:NAD(P)-dependent dehydrogenase (short-subunit alcohol dehydrogenase family)